MAASLSMPVFRYCALAASMVSTTVAGLAFALPAAGWALSPAPASPLLPLGILTNWDGFVAVAFVTVMVFPHPGISSGIDGARAIRHAQGMTDIHRYLRDDDGTF